MRSSLVLLGLALLGSSSCTAPDGPPKNGGDVPRQIMISPADGPPLDGPQAEQTTYEVVRVDPTSFEQAELGRVAFDAGPPFTARFVAGSAELEGLVAALNEVGEFRYSNGKPVARTDERYFEFLRREWIEAKHQLSLRVPSKTDAVTRSQLLALEAGELRRLGTVERNDVDYLRVVDGPTEHRARLGALLEQVNRVEHDAIEVPPPNGERGQYAQIIARGTPTFFALLRDTLLDAGAVLVGPDQASPQAATIVGPGPKLWAPAGMSATQVVHPVVIALSGPPGGPLGARVLHYDDVTYDDAALLAYVQAQHGDDPSFELGAATQVEIAGRRLRAVSYRTGSSLARSTHLTALWPGNYTRSGMGSDMGSDTEPMRDSGHAIELTLGGELEPADLLAHPQLAIVAASLQR